MSALVTLRGRLTKNPELRFTNGGKALVQFTVVTARRFKDAQGDWQEKDTSFWDVTAFDKLAENIAENWVKGTLVIVAGSMYQEKWVNKEGENRTSWKFLADDGGSSLRSAPKDGQSSKSGDGPPQAVFNEAPPF
jgi:single-strand DNA-binding protein